MDRKCVVWFGLLIFLLAADISVSAADVTSNVEKKSDTLGPQNSTVSTGKNGSDAELSKLEPNVGNQRLSPGKEGKGVDEGSQVTEEYHEKNQSSMKTDLKGTPDVGKGNESQTQHQTENGGLKDVSTSEDKSKASVVAKGRDSDVLKSPLKENSRAEECDESNRCVDEKNKLIACLRVPGNDSPDLSLLIQNKGSRPLAVKISAPDYVKLEETRVQLKENENKKVKVSVGSVINNTSVNLTTGSGYCNLDFRDLNLPNTEQTEHLLMSTLSIFPSASALYLLLAMVLLAASAWTCIRFWKRNEHGYEKVDMELPVSAGGKTENGQTDGWDNSWGDSWDDEEAPMTPSKPVSCLSSKGLASRRSNNKDGWKD
ncbi:hypothetical protein H6P81_014436 [Aristolochia fimbriata]|uniref:DUF7356 domain-containing protein n=1 Tax=Aristolochia fimbriata TaxID=158543 RepID=A0AAV7EM41_ARIFI|nr:hypothetical protein H6P81_014436 [Aristolochia fimbriata]